MLTDLRLALRLLARNRGFAIGVCLLLALGLGANIAIFTIVDSAVLRPLPYKDAARLVRLTTWSRKYGYGTLGVWGQRQADVRAMRGVFECVECYQRNNGATTWRRQKSTTALYIGRFTPGMLRQLDVTPAIGRSFTAQDAAAGNVVLIGQAFWQRAFARNPSVLGQTLVLDDRPYTVVGVVPSTLRYAVGPPARGPLQSEESFSDAFDYDAWLPLDDRVAVSGAGDSDQIARLRPGLSLPAAQREVNLATARLRNNEPAVWRDFDLKVYEFGRFRQPVPGGLLLSLWAAAAFVLLIAYANVANLLLYRTLSREQEIGVHVSLGATRWRLARQFLVEALLIAGASGALATFVARWVIDAVPALAPFAISWLFATRSPQLDTRVLIFALLATVATAVACAAVPSLRASRALSRGLRAGQSVIGMPAERRSTTRALESLQVAFTVVLLAGFAAILGSFVHIVRADLGFKVDGLAYADVRTTRGPSATPPAEVMEDLLARVRRLPGVEAVTLGPNPAGGFFTSRVNLDESQADSALMSWARIQPDHFRVAGIALLAGRSFGPQDRSGQAPVIVSETTARQLWPGRSAVGQRLHDVVWGWMTVVGVAADVKASNFTNKQMNRLQGWMPVQRPDDIGGDLLLRITGDSGAVLKNVRDLVKAADPTLEVQRSGEVADLYADTVAPARFYTLLAGFLALTGLLTAAVGLYGLVSFTVRQRTREIGLRMALGANVARVGRLVVAEAMEPVLVGGAIGLAAAYLVAPLLASVLYQTAANDISILAGVATVLAASAALAVAGPLRRATRIDPAEALRAE